MPIQFEGEWKYIPDSDLRVLAEEVYLQLSSWTRHEVPDELLLLAMPQDSECPKTLHRIPGDILIRIWLCEKANYIGFIYEFAHELCHVMSPYETLSPQQESGPPRPNNWFHEALCVMTATHVLRVLGEKWKTSPPSQRPDWRNRGDELIERSARYFDCPRRNAPDGMTPADWLKIEEPSLRKDRYDGNSYHRNATLGYSLLPIFKRYPKAWSTITYLHDSEAWLGQYLREWHQLVDPEDYDLVNELAQACAG